jgi:salicylate hydroxylase
LIEPLDFSTNVVMRPTLRIGIVGGGVGGLAAALALSQRGFETHVFEQSREFAEIGAGVSLTPNGVKILRALGLEQAIRTSGFEPEAIVGRDLVTGDDLFCVPLQGTHANYFGAPTVDMHRADLLRALKDASSGVCLHLDARCTAIAHGDREVAVRVNKGMSVSLDLLVGCDGIRSVVREALHGFDAPRFTGNMCWRALIPAAGLTDAGIEPKVTLWIGQGRHIVTFLIRGGTLINMVAVQETDKWTEGSWSTHGSPDELRNAFPDTHAKVRALLRRVEHCFKWGLFDRDPLPTWSKGRATLLGDAAHPMLPFLGQGASMAMEDGFVLARELARAPDDIAEALCAYEAERVPRTAKVQLAAREQAKLLHLSPAAPGRSSIGDGALLERFDWLYQYNPAL